MPPSSARLHVVLVAPEIPWNSGNAGRTCLGAGAELHLVGPLGFSLDDRHLRRAGLDYWPRVRLSVWPGWEAFAAELPRLGEPFFFAARGRRLHWQVRYPERAVLIFGSESVGLPPPLLAEHAERTVRIPMQDGALHSLNLSTSVGIAVYEAWRQGEAGGASPDDSVASPAPGSG